MADFKNGEPPMRAPARRRNWRTIILGVCDVFVRRNWRTIIVSVCAMVVLTVVVCCCAVAVMVAAVVKGIGNGFAISLPMGIFSFNYIGIMLIMILWLIELLMLLSLEPFALITKLLF
jgi:hypothetical protein